MLQASCPDPVGPLLVFLDLLKRQAKCITELLNLDRISPHGTRLPTCASVRSGAFPFTSSISRGYQRQ